MSIPSLAVQLYTLRDALREDLDGTLARVADIGYTQVEAFNFVGHEEEIGQALGDHGLTAPSAHAPLLTENVDQICSAANTIGADTVICPSSERSAWHTLDGIKRIADGLNAAAERAAVYDVRIGYHNHAFELEPTIDGRPALEALPQFLDPEVVLEVDTYWVAVGGADPVEVLANLGDRVRFIHLKDGPITSENLDQVAVGQGAMPVWDIIDAAAAVEVGIVELDDSRADTVQAIADSYAYLTAGRAAA